MSEKICKCSSVSISSTDTLDPNFNKKLFSRITIDTFMILYQLGICCCYIVFVATNVKQIVDYYVVELDVKIHMLILLVPLILLNCIRNLKVLAPFSSLANVITFVGKINQLRQKHKSFN